jgi:hypothetical protein
MSLVEKHIVVPYRFATKGKDKRLVPGEMRPASSAEGARRVAEAMSTRFAGVAAFSVYVDQDSGDMTSPVELARFGEVPELDT